MCEDAVKMKVSTPLFCRLAVCSYLATAASSGSLLTKHDSLSTCLAAASVPIDAPSSSNWTADALPYNKRLAYNPIAIAVPNALQHIQDAVKCAAQNGLKANAKSGGHSYASFGLGGEDGHLVIELDRMNAVKVVDNSTGVAMIEGGARLGHVATKLYTQGGRAMAHGTCPGYVFPSPYYMKRLRRSMGMNSQLIRKMRGTC